MNQRDYESLLEHGAKAQTERLLANEHINSLPRPDNSDLLILIMESDKEIANE